MAAIFFDYDGDGWLDLFVGNNVTFDNSGATVCRSLSGAPDYCGPGAYPYQADRLYRNLGGVAAVRWSLPTPRVAAAWRPRPPRPTLGAVTADFDGDGWVDLYVANDGQPNNLWLNHRDGTLLGRGAARRLRGQLQRRRPRPAWGSWPATSTATATPTCS